jgi:acylphosphatase
MAKRVHIIVSGRVQGVCFRAYTLEYAGHQGLTGIVRNLPNGDVEIVAEGERAAIESLVAWARTGPSSARVDDVGVSYEEATGEYPDFRIAW